MQIYLPIAEVSVSLLQLLALGSAVGFLSGMFGVGGGFLMTPLLFFIGVPPAVAVATGATQIVASSFSGLLAHIRRKTVDFRMGGVLLVGGIAGSAAGVRLFSWLRELGQAELFVSLAYVVFLGIVGFLMLVESIRALRREGKPKARSKQRHGWAARLPLKLRFRTSQLYISVIPPALIGASVGVLAAIMGVGGGFIMVPAMIYLLGIPTVVVIGTSLFQILFVTAFTTLMHATQNYTVDALLAIILIVGGVIGAQFGAQVGARLKGEELRILLALLVVAVCLKLAFDITVRPDELYTIAGRTG